MKSWLIKEDTVGHEVHVSLIAFSSPLITLLDLHLTISFYRLEVCLFDRKIPLRSHEVVYSASRDFESFELVHQMLCHLLYNCGRILVSKVCKGFLCSSVRTCLQPLFLPFSKILSGHSSYYLAHLCAVRTWISNSLAAAEALKHLSNFSLKNLAFSWSV